MIFIDYPYVSDLLRQNIKASGLPLVQTPNAVALGWLPGTSTLSEDEAVTKLRLEPDTPVYASSENALDWVSRNVPNSRLPSCIDIFKDKIRFRNELKSLFPHFHFEQFQLNELHLVDPTSWPFPCVVKPNVGFFSLGVYRLDSPLDWPRIRESLEAELQSCETMYPKTVLNLGTFIVEEWIEGDEYAVDAFFNHQGDPIILNITKHLFSSEKDTGDRVYLTSKAIMERMQPHALDFLEKLKGLSPFNNFPLHFEFRINEESELIPIEVNPMRFGAWCTTGDLATHAWNFNPLEHFRLGTSPDWNQVFAGKEDDLFSMVLLNNNSGYEKHQVETFDHDLFLKAFKNPIEYRPIPDPKYPLFGILFTKTHRSDIHELESILHSNLQEFLTLKKGAAIIPPLGGS